MLDTLPSIPLFEQIAPEALAGLRRRAVTMNFQSGECIWMQGTSADFCPLVTRGAAKVLDYSADGKETLLYLIGRETPALLPPLDIDRHTSMGVALKETEILGLHFEDLWRTLRSTESLRENFAEHLLRQRLHLCSRLEEVTIDGADHRLALLLIRLTAGDRAAAIPVSGHDELALELRLTQEGLAAMLGLCRATINRTLSRWQKAGHIGMANRRITVHDRRWLQEMAGELSVFERIRAETKP